MGVQSQQDRLHRQEAYTLRVPRARPLSWRLVFIAALLLLGIWKSLPGLPVPFTSETPARVFLTCTENPSGLSLQVLPISDPLPTHQEVYIHGRGFTPGEALFVLIEGYGTERSARVEQSNLLVQEDGTFSERQSLRRLEPTMGWQVYVVHQRGVACASWQIETKE